MNQFDPTFTAQRLVLAKLNDDADAYQAAVTEFDPERQTLDADRVMFVLVNWLAGELKLLAALGPQLDELITQAAKIDPDTLRAQAIAHVESERDTRVIANADAQFDDPEADQ